MVLKTLNFKFQKKTKTFTKFFFFFNIFKINKSWEKIVKY